MVEKDRRVQHANVFVRFHVFVVHGKTAVRILDYGGLFRIVISKRHPINLFAGIGFFHIGVHDVRHFVDELHHHARFAAEPLFFRLALRAIAERLLVFLPEHEIIL